VGPPRAPCPPHPSTHPRPPLRPLLACTLYQGRSVSGAKHQQKEEKEDEKEQEEEEELEVVVAVVEEEEGGERRRGRNLRRLTKSIPRIASIFLYRPPSHPSLPALRLAPALPFSVSRAESRETREKRRGGTNR
jgi:hypothetical protein